MFTINYSLFKFIYNWRHCSTISLTIVMVCVCARRVCVRLTYWSAKQWDWLSHARPAPFPFPLFLFPDTYGLLPSESGLAVFIQSPNFDLAWFKQSGWSMLHAQLTYNVYCVNTLKTDLGKRPRRYLKKFSRSFLRKYRLDWTHCAFLWILDLNIISIPSLRADSFDVPCRTFNLNFCKSTNM